MAYNPAETFNIFELQLAMNAFERERPPNVDVHDPVPSALFAWLYKPRRFGSVGMSQATEREFVRVLRVKYPRITPTNTEQQPPQHQPLPLQHQPLPLQHQPPPQQQLPPLQYPLSQQQPLHLLPQQQPPPLQQPYGEYDISDIIKYPVDSAPVPPNVSNLAAALRGLHHIQQKAWIRDTINTHANLKFPRGEADVITKMLLVKRHVDLVELVTDERALESELKITKLMYDVVVEHLA